MVLFLTEPVTFRYKDYLSIQFIFYHSEKVEINCWFYCEQLKEFEICKLSFNQISKLSFIITIKRNTPFFK
jgi:hypothetical protein